MWKILSFYGNRKSYAIFTLGGAGLFSKITAPNTHDHIEEYDEEEKTEGWKRLKKMFSHNSFGSLSPQLTLVKDMGLLSFMCGSLLGCAIEGGDAYTKYIRENKMTTYVSNYEAQRKLQDSIILSSMKGGWRVGWRFGFVTSSMLLFLTIANTYRGHSSILEFTAGGFIACSVYKLKDGPKPALAGGIVGAGMGTLMGVVIISLMKIFDFSFENLYDIDKIEIEKRDLARKEKLESLRRVHMREQSGFHRPYKQMSEEDDDTKNS